jgi:histone H3/H4
VLSALDLYVAERTMHLQVEENLQEAAFHRLLRQAGMQRRGWASQRVCCLLCQLGHLLVALGERLRQYGLPSSRPLEGQMRGGR